MKIELECDEGVFWCTLFICVTVVFCFATYRGTEYYKTETTSALAAGLVQKQLGGSTSVYWAKP